MFKIDGDLEVTIAEAYVTEAKFPAKAGEINNRNEYVQVFYDVVVLLKDAEGNTDTWHGEISNRTGTGTYAHMYRLDLTLKTLQDIGFNVRSLQELEQQFVANEKREIVIPNMVGIGCRATVEKSEKLNKYGQPYFNVRYLNALSSGPKRLSFDTLMSAVLQFRRHRHPLRLRMLLPLRLPLLPFRLLLRLLRLLRLMLHPLRHPPRRCHLRHRHRHPLRSPLRSLLRSLPLRPLRQLRLPLPCRRRLARIKEIAVVIVIDTREQRPWSFPPYIDITVGTLRTGDYALQGDDHFAIERKSADDFIGTISLGWHRFTKELNRMDAASFAAKVVIVESDFETFCFRTRQGMILPPDHEHTRCTPQFVMKRIAELSMRGVSVIFAGNADLASAIALRLFIEREKQLEKEKIIDEK